MEKTNVMRILEQHKISYTAYEYPHEDGVCVDGKTVAELLHQDYHRVFKTLVVCGKSKAYYVFVLPILKELDLKKAARVGGEKAVEMIPVKELNSVTGYIRGGCSPIGMKKSFKTVIDNAALSCERIIFSAGKIGYQVEVNPKDLNSFLRVDFCDISVE